MAGRQSTRRLAQQLCAAASQPHLVRSFSSLPARFAAHNLTMPAMSPTMTEGNIASWKVKEGDTFSTGDVLLEIETDKATIDVEAQDDGVMAKIFEQDGAKGVQVGSRIAVLGDAGDDVSSLEIPPEESKPAPSESKPEESKESKESAPAPSEPAPPKQDAQPKQQSQKSSAKTPSGPGQNPKYPLYPSVIALLHANHISDSDIPKIPASGPQNRLLKGDVLAYLGSISSSYPQEQSKRLTHLAHLDLSNIKLLQQQPSKPAAPSPSAASPAAPQTTSISLPISLSSLLATQKRLSDTLNTTIPLTTFLARAVDLANDDLPLSKNSKPTSDALFNAVLGLDKLPTTSRGTYLPQITALPPSATSFTRSAPSALRARPSQKPDILDILTSSSSTRRTSSRRAAPSSTLTSPIGGSISTTGGAVNIFSITVPAGEEKRGRTFLERVKTVLTVEPGRLVL